MKFTKFAVVLLAAPLMTAPAQAAVLTYNVAGIFTDGSVLSGRFSFDNAGPAISQFSNISLNVTGAVSATVTSFSGINYQNSGGSNLPFAIQASSAGTSIRVGTFGNYTSAPVLTAITSSALTPGTGLLSTVFINGGATIGLASGTITNASAVPEPTSWAMLTLGFGGLGAALRRRERVPVACA